MNIAIVCQNVVRTAGHGRVNYRVARKAAEQGHHVSVLSDTIAPDLPSRDNVSWVHIDVQKWPTQLVKDQVFAWRSARWIRTNRPGIDVIMTTGFVTWAPADVCMVQFVHSSWVRSPQHSWHTQGGLEGAYQTVYSRANARFERRVFHEAQSLIAVSHAIRDELIQLGLPEDKIAVVHNGVDLDEFYPGTEKRSLLGVPESVPLALFAGDIRTPRKNLDTILRALTDVPGVHLAVAGATEGSPYPDLSRELGLSDRVHFLGFRSDLPKLMRAADFFVFPSRYEACALVLVEALASGLPVITARTTGGAEIIQPDCGIRIQDPNDTAALTKAIRELTSDPQLRSSMSTSAREAAETYNFDTIADAYLGVFETLGQPYTRQL
jgi:glycosyltransferase involved in cell wall biosynthesis